MTIDVKKLINVLEAIPIETYKVNDITYVVEITYEKNKYIGTAYCHPDDAEFRSDLIGYHIAYLRAVKKVLTKYRDLAEAEYKVIKKLTVDIIQGYEDNLEEVDPTFRLSDYCFRSALKVAKYRIAIRQAQRSIHQYLADQEKAITSLRKQKSIEAKED